MCVSSVKPKGKPVTADVYSVRVNLRFINLVYIRVENDASWSLGLRILFELQ